MNFEQISGFVWEIIFNEKLEEIPDPNQPENLPYIKAIKKQKIDALKNFREGPGKPLFEQLQLEARADLWEVLTKQIKCDCPVCLKLIKVQYIFQLIANIERTIKEN